MGTYLYAVMPEEQHIDLGCLGLPDGWGRVTTVTGGGLAAVVSDYQGPAFSQLPKADLLRCLAIHQRVIERAMADQLALPVKFGTVLDSETKISVMLNTWCNALSNAMAALGDAIEIEVVATWDLSRILSEVARRPSIASMKTAIQGRPFEETLAARVEIGKLVREDFEHRREETRRVVVQDLTLLARDIQHNALPSDELVLNVAFLVERARLNEFYGRVHRLDHVFGNQLTFRCIGPLPPYSFATVEISQPRADDIEGARRLLELGELISELELNAKYRRLAAKCHPDHHPEDPMASERFAALATAYYQLLAYIRCQQAGQEQADKNTRCNLAPEAIKTTLLLTIKRFEQQLFSQVEDKDERSAVAV